MYDGAIVVGCDDETCSAAFICFGPVCITGYCVARRVVYVLLEVVSVYFWLVTRGDDCKVVHEVKGRSGKVTFNIWRDVCAFHELVVDGCVRLDCAFVCGWLF